MNHHLIPIGQVPEIVTVLPGNEIAVALLIHRDHRGPRVEVSRASSYYLAKKSEFALGGLMTGTSRLAGML